MNCEQFSIQPESSTEREELSVFVKDTAETLATRVIEETGASSWEEAVKKIEELRKEA